MKKKNGARFVCIFSDGDSRIASVRLWREECGKEDAETITVFMEHKLYENMHHISRNSFRISMSSLL